jgi:hypothetical protein
MFDAMFSLFVDSRLTVCNFYYFAIAIHQFLRNSWHDSYFITISRFVAFLTIIPELPDIILVGKIRVLPRVKYRFVTVGGQIENRVKYGFVTVRNLLLVRAIRILP